MGGDCTVKKRAAVLVVMTGKKRAWNDETRLSQGATEQKQHTKGCVSGWCGRMEAKQAVDVPNVFRLQIDNCQAIKPKTFPADWTGLDWTGRWLNSRCVRVGSSETE